MVLICNNTDVGSDSIVLLYRNWYYTDTLTPLKKIFFHSMSLFADKGQLFLRKFLFLSGSFSAHFPPSLVFIIKQSLNFYSDFRLVNKWLS